MEKKTLYAIVAAAVLGLGAFAIMRQPEKGQRVGPPPRPIPALKAVEITRLEITSEKQEKSVLEKKGATWRVVEPKDWPADQTAVKSLLDGLEKMAFADVVTESPEKFTDLAVADGKASRVAIKNGANMLADLIVGKAVSGYTMVRPAGKNEVWQASGIYGYMLNREPKGFRDHNVVEFAQVDCDKLTVDAGGAKLVVEKIPAEKDKPGAETKWKIAESTADGPKTSEALDQAMVNGAIQSLATLKAVDFADEKKPEETGLAKPWLTLTAHAGGKDYGLMLGGLVADSMYVQAAGSPVIYTVNKYAIERAGHRPVDFKDKTMAKVKEVDLSSIDVSHAGDPWSADRSEDGKWKGRGKNLDEAKLKPIVSSFENLQADGFAEEKDPGKTGLAKPALTIGLHLRDKSTVTIKVGNKTKDEMSYYAQRVGSPEVMRIKKFLADRWMKKAGEMAPGAAPSNPAAQVLAAEKQKIDKKKKN
jgi:hypothetical protein